MKNIKKLLPIIILAIVVIIGGAFYLKGKKTGGVTPNGETSAFSSISDALSKSLSLTCEFTDDEGVKTVSYIKNGAIRVSSEGNEEVGGGGAIFKDGKAYMWNEGEKEGILMSFDMNAGELAEGEDGNLSAASYISAMEKYKDKCKVTTVADSLFIPPADVNFVDMDSFLKDSVNYPVEMEQ